MHTIYGTFATAGNAGGAINALIDQGVSAAALHLWSRDTWTGAPHDFEEAPFLLAVTMGSVATQPLVEDTLHDHDAGRVFGASQAQPVLEDVPHATPTSTGTYEMASPVGGGEHRIDVTTDVIAPG